MQTASRKARLVNPAREWLSASDELCARSVVPNESLIHVPDSGEGRAITLLYFMHGIYLFPLARHPFNNGIEAVDGE